MRVEVARHFGGVPFAPPYRDMSQETLLLLYAEAMRHRRESMERRRDDWGRGDVLARFIGMIANPEVYQRFLEQEKLEDLKEEMTPEQAKFDFESLREAGLEFLEVIMPEEEYRPAPEIEDEVIRAALERANGLDAFRRAIGESYDDPDDVPFTVDAASLVDEENEER